MRVISLHNHLENLLGLKCDSNVIMEISKPKFYKVFSPLQEEGESFLVYLKLIVIPIYVSKTCDIKIDVSL